VKIIKMHIDRFDMMQLGKADAVFNCSTDWVHPVKGMMNTHRREIVTEFGIGNLEHLIVQKIVMDIVKCIEREEMSERPQPDMAIYPVRGANKDTHPFQCMLCFEMTERAEVSMIGRNGELLGHLCMGCFANIYRAQRDEVFFRREMI